MESHRKPAPPDSGGRMRGGPLPVVGAHAAPPRAHSAPPRAHAASPPVVSFVSLGCAKNLVDSEAMLGQIAESGALLSGDESLADTVVVNTCGFLESSRVEALEILRELAQRKREGRLRRIVVAGCLVQRDGRSIREAVPEVDALVGVNNRADVVRAVWDAQHAEAAGSAHRTAPAGVAAVDCYMGDYHASSEKWSDKGRLRLTPRHFAYLRISEGCDQKCTFCTIPSIRGPMHSKPPDEIVAEARELIADGAREIILIGQDTTSYGFDLGFEPGLAGLLRRLDAECEGAEWIRLMYVYPSVLTDGIIDAIAECERVVKYIDMPLQHINDRILRAMYRRVTRAQTEGLLERIRGRIPQVSLRTTFIVGFPGETEVEFRELTDFVRSARFDAVGAFMYSREPETPAGRMRGQCDGELLRARYAELMEVQQAVAFERARGNIGRTLRVVVEGRDSRGPFGRHAQQAPEVDGICRLPDVKVPTGAFVTARCTGSEGYDLILEPLARSRPRPVPRGASRRALRAARTRAASD